MSLSKTLARICFTFSGALLAFGIITDAVTALTEPTPAQRTCADFRAWQQRPGSSELNTLLTDSLSAPWVPIGEDVSLLYFDTRSGMLTKYETADAAAYCAQVN